VFKGLLTRSGFRQNVLQHGPESSLATRRSEVIFPQAPWQHTNVLPTESKHWFGRGKVGSHVAVGTGVVKVPRDVVPGTFVELPAHAAGPETHSGVGQHATKAPSSE
jgi:hypothetical protein